MPHIDNKTITVELSSDETSVLSRALLEHMMRLKSMPSLFAYADMSTLATICRKMQDAITVLETDERSRT